MLAVQHLRDLGIDPATHPRGRAFLSAASGLVLDRERLYVVADDEHHLAVFDALAPGNPGRLIRLFEGDLPKGQKKRKALKPDVETLARLPEIPGCRSGALLGLGSGSRPNRKSGVLMPLGADGAVEASVRHVDLTPLYAPLRDDFKELNIEGALVVGDELLLLQRGNKGGSSNACIHFAWDEVLPWLLGRSTAPVQASAVRHYDLGSVEGVPLCFTDGAPLPNGAWVFSAVAENVDDSYNDGACAGASIGIVDAKGTLRAMRALARTLKVEGVAARLDGDALMLVMVTDADDPAIPSQLLSARLSLSDSLKA